ncbi:SPRY domain-containing protein 7 isoform X1 [Columba livia]|uniref:SPRY domain-containing protein 7 isoform X1 n=2 Tax=Neoaves TaxID=3078114 RepID=UPI0031BB3BBF
MSRHVAPGRAAGRRHPPVPPRGTTSRPPGGAAEAPPLPCPSGRRCVCAARRGPASHGRLRVLLLLLVQGRRRRTHPAEGDAGGASRHAAHGFVGFFLLPGTDVVIVKNGRRICGTGGCLANAPLHQNKSYFEFKVQSTGIWGIGVATQKANLNQIPLGRDVHSLVMRNDGALYYNNEEKNRLPANSLPQEGDVVGITYDHVELNVYLNGKNMHCPASGIRGTVYPVVYVDDSAILDCQFSEFYHTPPPGFEKILFEQQIF